MKCRPILFSAPMVRALLDGRKSKTRRALKRQFLDVLPMNDGLGWLGLIQRGTEEVEPKGEAFRCKFGVPGDLLWVRETWAHVPMREADGGQSDKMGVIYKADGESALDEIPEEWEFSGKWIPSIHMFRWASRITLRITDVRCERLQDISDVDAIAEGIEPVGDDWKSYEIIHEGRHKGTPHPHSAVPNRSPVVSYRELWESINGKDSWAANPWVWALSFEVVK